MTVHMLTEYPEVKGIFVGGCVERGEGSSFRAMAHAHYHVDEAKQKKMLYSQTQIDAMGWICVRSSKRLYTTDGRPSQLMLHELAHILTSHGHTDKWRAKARELGYRLPARYQKHKRK